MEMTGYRYIETLDGQTIPAIGDTLPNSYAWDGDEPTDQELPGTCAFATLAAAKKYAKFSAGCGSIVEIEGELSQGETDIEDEIVLSDARMVRVVEIC